MILSIQMKGHLFCQPASEMYCPQRTQPRITGRAFRISFHLDWHFDNGIFNRPIVVPTQILVHRWGPEQGLQRCFAGSLNQSLVSSAVQATFLC